MNKKLEEAFRNAGVTFQGSRGYGVVHGFETNVVFSNVYSIGIQFSCYATDEQKRCVLNALAAEKIKFSRFAFGKFGLCVALNDWTLASLAKRLGEVLEKICGTLSSCGALGVGYCPFCGNELDFEQSKKCNVEGMTVSLDIACVENINGLIDEENKALDTAPNNYLRGFVGAILGSLAGVALAVVLYALGFISAISAFVAFFVGELLYKKFGGKQNYVMIVILSVTVLAMMLLSVVGIYVVSVAIQSAEAGLTTAEGWRICMQDEEFRRGFTSDLLLTMLFTVLGCVYEVVQLVNRNRRQKNI